MWSEPHRQTHTRPSRWLNEAKTLFRSSKRLRRSAASALRSTPGQGTEQRPNPKKCVSEKPTDALRLPVPSIINNNLDRVPGWMATGGRAKESLKTQKTENQIHTQPVAEGESGGATGGIANGEEDRPLAFLRPADATLNALTTRPARSLVWSVS